MRTKNIVNLENNKNEEIVDLLNVLVNYQIYYQNLRGFHFEYVGDQFF